MSSNLDKCQNICEKQVKCNTLKDRQGFTQNQCVQECMYSIDKPSSVWTCLIQNQLPVDQLTASNCDNALANCQSQVQNQPSSCSSC